MSGKLIDLSSSTMQLPDRVVLDTNVAVARMLGSDVQPHPAHALQAAALFRELQVNERRAILTPTVFSELLHISIKARYQTELRFNRHDIMTRYGTRITSWTALFKRDRSILGHHTAELERLRHRLIARNIVIAAPDDLGPIPSGLGYDEELVHLIGHYELDTNDTLILMEASRLGVPAIVTMDADLHRAAIDFDIYTWL